jgi:hypothetical protein
LKPYVPSGRPTRDSTATLPTNESNYPISNIHSCKPDSCQSIDSAGTIEVLQSLNLDDDDLFTVPCIYCAKKYGSRREWTQHVQTCSKKPAGSTQTSDDRAADAIASQNGFSNHIHQDLNIDIEDQNKIFQLIVKEQHKKIMEMSKLMRFVNQFLTKYLEREISDDEES